MTNEQTCLSLRAALIDISTGANMMLQIPGNSQTTFGKFANEVKRVAEAGLAGTIATPARPLTDVDVRHEETDDGVVAGGRIEVSTFSEGEYVESVFITRARARELYFTLGQLLDE